MNLFEIALQSLFIALEDPPINYICDSIKVVIN